MNTSLKLLLASLATILFSAAISYGVVEHRIKKIAMVDAVKLFNAYKMKADLEHDAKGVLNLISGKVDSLEKEIKLVELSKDEGKKKELMQYYGFYRSKYEDEYKKSNQIINEEVWKRLNPLLDEYGKQHKYNLIMGANGMGSILYNDSFYDITQEIINYVNNKYEKGL